MSQRFRALGESGNYSQDGVAAVAGVSQVTWSNWEKQPPNQFEALARLAQHYGVSADYLLGLIDDPAGRRDLTPELQEISRIWAELDGEQRRLVLDTMKMLVKVRTPHIIGGEDK